MSTFTSTTVNHSGRRDHYAPIGHIELTPASAAASDPAMHRHRSFLLTSSSPMAIFSSSPTSSMSPRTARLPGRILILSAAIILLVVTSMVATRRIINNKVSPLIGFPATHQQHPAVAVPVHVDVSVDDAAPVMHLHNYVSPMTAHACERSAATPCVGTLGFNSLNISPVVRTCAGDDTVVASCACSTAASHVAVVHTTAIVNSLRSCQCSFDWNPTLRQHHGPLTGTQRDLKASSVGDERTDPVSSARSTTSTTTNIHERDLQWSMVLQCKRIGSG